MKWLMEKATAVWLWLKGHNTVWFIVFVLVYALAWALNALAETKFVLKEWEEMGKYIMGKYGTDSLLNTPIPGMKGEKHE